MWEKRDWINFKNGDIFKCITAWMRWRSGKTTMQWVKGHSGTKVNEETDRLASEGAREPAPKDFYRTLSEKRKIPPRQGTDVGIVQAYAQATFGLSPTTEEVWAPTRHGDLTRKTRDFLWGSTWNTYKIGAYWNLIEGFEQRGVCPLCDEQEDMDHILTSCTARPRTLAWELARIACGWIEATTPSHRD